jgi:outer membrane protein
MRTAGVLIVLVAGVSCVARAEMLTLREAERRATTGHPTVTLERWGAAAADARVVEARAALLPQVVLSANYHLATANRTIRIGTSAALAALRPPPNASLWDYLTAGLTATQLLTDFGQSTEALRAARLLADSAALDARAARQAVLLDVRLAFFAARARRELVAVAREDVDNQRRHLAEVEGFVTVRMRPPIDLVQARAGVGAAELRLIAAENDYALARADLDRAMGGGPSVAGYDVTSEELPPVDGERAPGDALAAEAAAGRPDLASARRQVEAEDRALASARGAYAPALHLALGATDAGPMFTPGPFEARNLRWNYSAALVLSWPLFEGRRTVGRVREAEAMVGQAVARGALVDLGIRVEVERARRGVAAAQAAIAVAETTLENARQRLRLAEGRYQAGAAAALEVSDAQLMYVTSAADQVRARYDLSTARAQLLHALGRD